MDYLVVKKKKTELCVHKPPTNQLSKCMNQGTSTFRNPMLLQVFFSSFSVT